MAKQSGLLPQSVGTDEQFIHLVMRYLDGQTSTEEAACLRQRLATSQDDRRTFVALCFQSRALREAELPRHESEVDPSVVEESETAAILREVIDEERRARAVREKQKRAECEKRSAEIAERRRIQTMYMRPTNGEGKRTRHYVIPTPIFYGGVAAVIAIVITLILPLFERLEDHRSAERPVVAVIDDAQGAVWAQRRVEVRQGERHVAAALVRGARLRQGDRYQLKLGIAQLQTQNGAIVVLQAPCGIEMIHENRIHLEYGKLVGKCPSEQSKGFTVDTPGVSVIDIGTEFDVNVDEAGTTDVYVRQGTIQVRRPTSETAVTLSRGQQARASAELSDDITIQSEVTLIGDRNCWVQELNPDKVYPSNFPTNVWSSNIPGVENGHRRYAVIAFDLTTLPGPVTAATLSLWSETYGWSDDQRPLKQSAIAVDGSGFDADAATWNQVAAARVLHRFEQLGQYDIPAVAYEPQIDGVYLDSGGTAEDAAFIESVRTGSGLLVIVMMADEDGTAYAGAWGSGNRPVGIDDRIIINSDPRLTITTRIGAADPANNERAAP